MKRIIHFAVVIALAASASASWAQFVPGNAQTPLERAQWLAEEDALPQARRALLDALDVDPHNLELNFQLGLIELEMGNPAAAELAFSSAADAFSSRYDLLFNRAVALTAAERNQEAADLLFEMVDSGAVPTDLAPTAMGLLGGAAFDAGDYDTATLAFQVLHRITESPYARFRELQTRFANGERAEVVIPLREVREEVGYEASFLLARLYEDLDLVSYAERELLDARQRATEHLDFEAMAEATSRLGRILYQQDRFGDMIEYLSQLEGDHRNAELAYQLAAAHIEVDDPASAVDVLSPYQESTDVLALLGVAAYQAGEYEQAAAAGEKLLRTLDSSGADGLPASVNKAIVAAALAQIELGRPDEALSFTSQLRLNDLAEPELTSIADIHYAIGNYSRAVEVYREAINSVDVEETPGVETLRGLADALLAEKRFSEARSAYENVIAVAPYDTEAWFYYGWASSGLQNWGEAQEAWEVAAERGYEPAVDALARY